jgi:type I restriction-modification system DNA methylase subunit
MTDLTLSFLSRAFLRSHWDIEFKAWLAEGKDATILEALQRWAARHDLKETSAEAAFTEEFFRNLWGYSQSGQINTDEGFTLFPKYSIQGAGAKGGTGEADLAIGYFNSSKATEPPQVLCEFKDMKSSLDADQKRKGNTRSPVRQCLDYLSNARRGMIGSEPVIPTWGIVSDMNEFRLYWYDRGHTQFLRFIIQPRDLFQGGGLLASTEEAKFERFLFARIFHKDTLLTRGGRSALLGLIQQQRFKDRELEKQFYNDYKRVRDKLYQTLLEHNPEGTNRFPGTRGRLVRLAQKLLDRMIFVFFCEDMGRALAFPPQLLRNFFITRSNDEYFDADSFTLWSELKNLFSAMNDGTKFGPEKINKFNGGLFAPDLALEKLQIPNIIFCQKSQGQNEASLYQFKDTMLYLCASYNYASTWAQGLDRAPLVEQAQGETKAVQSLGLYTLGRIFEQSITELEILEAEADGRLSINKESKRKRDGVYYTPEWVVERIVDETLSPRFAEIKRECGWPDDGLPTVQVIDAFITRLRVFTVLDPACGSGAFLITSLRYLVDEWRKLLELRKQISGSRMAGDDDDALIRDVMRSNIYGVDINAASVEIAQLALWLHTARGDKPLSSLSSSIKEGNSLIDSGFYKGQVDFNYNMEEKERINAFDWWDNFPEVKARGGFDAIVGNPPYVKLQNFRKVHEDMAGFLRDGRVGTDVQGYKSAKTGNFDLYLPFIERGLSLLNDNGRLGYIAPSLWTVNEYGEGLRAEIMKSRSLERWIDFKAHQIFEEATVYTSLQFFTKQPNDEVRIVSAPDGKIKENAFANDECVLPYKRLAYGERWLLATGCERDLIDRLAKACKTLDDKSVTKNIFVGIQTSADDIYHLQRKGPGRYVSYADGTKNGYEIEIEDAVMKPLVSGAEAKRYVLPKTNTYLLFPYELGVHVKLISEATFKNDYPKAWKYLKSWEERLRKRENKKMDHDDSWWAYNYPKNLDKQSPPKLIVPRLVANLICAGHESDSMYLDNVDVGGIQPAEGIELFFLVGLLNSTVLSFIFKRISKPFRGEYLSANKQFIAPLPIPNATAKQQASISQAAKNLQTAHSRRRDLLSLIAKRMETLRKIFKPETWLFAGMKSKIDWELEAPKALDLTEKRNWAAARFSDELNANETAIGERLKPAATLDASFKDGEISFYINGIPVITSIFEDEASGSFILAQWKVLATSMSITEKTTGKKLCVALRKLAVYDSSSTVQQVIEYQTELSTLDTSIAMQEADMNAAVYKLYGLSSDEIKLVEKG